MGRGLHVVAGRAKGVPLTAPRGARPTAGRVREALFSALGDVQGASVLDLYAGSGALAIEALSRGAEGALLVDRDRRAADACARNLEATDLAGRARVRSQAVGALLRATPPPEAPFDLVFVDPPYEMPAGEVADVVAELGGPGWLAPRARVVLERPAGPGAVAVPTGWVSAWQRRYGDTLVVILQEQD